MTTIGEELRRAREEAGLTQEQLAFEAEISRQYVSLLELDKKSPTLEVLLRLCSAMNVSAGTIVTRIENT